MAIARAVALHLKVMLFDEVTSALDPEMIGEVLEVMGTLDEEGINKVVLTHEVDFAREASGRMVFMEAGWLVEEASTDSFLTNHGRNASGNFSVRFYNPYPVGM